MSYCAFAQFYDSLTANVDYIQMAGFISAILKENKPDCSLVADLACGTGSISLCLDSMGYDMIGIDASPEMLSVARQKSPSNILYLCQPLHKLDLYGTIDAAICTLDSVNHITDDSILAKAFSKVSLFLEPDGIFIFDFNTEYKHKTILSNNCFVYELPELFCVWQNHTDESLLTAIDLDFFIHHGENYIRESEQFCERAYSVEKLSSILRDCSLDIIKLYDNYSLNEPCETSERIVCVCKKRFI